MSAHDRLNSHYRQTLDQVEADTGIKAGSTITWRLLRSVMEATTKWLTMGYSDHSERLDDLEARIERMEED